MSDSPSRPAAGADTRDHDVEHDETAALIASDKVEGTHVYDASGNELGTIHCVMIGKRDGRVAYAVLSFGGFFGMGQSFYPIPWNTLTYSRDHDGYITTVTEQMLTGAPHYESADADAWSDRGWRGSVDTHYGPAGRTTFPI